MSCGDSQEVTQCHQERKQTQLRCPDDSQHAIPLGPPCTASPEATIELSRNLSAGQCSSVASTMLTSCLVCHHAPRPILNAKRQCHACTSHSIPKRVFALLLIASLSADDVQGNAMDSPWTARTVIVWGCLYWLMVGLCSRMVIKFNHNEMRKGSRLLVWNGVRCGVEFRCFPGGGICVTIAHQTFTCIAVNTPQRLQEH